RVARDRGRRLARPLRLPGRGHHGAEAGAGGTRAERDAARGGAADRPSRQLCRIFEVGADETATLASLVERVHPDDVEVLRTAEARELAAGETSELEF